METKKKKRKKGGALYSKILFLLILVGTCMLLYPTFSEWWNSRYRLRDISEYIRDEEEISQEKYEEEWANANLFNSMIYAHHGLKDLSADEKKLYDSCLNIGNNGVMGFLEIPVIRLSLPVFHGTSEAVLRTGAGHIEGTSLPVGGEGTHCALSGHRGLVSADLFTNLDKIAEGDLFMLRILGETLTYKVDKISIVLPNDTELLLPEEGMDYCTLVTCTPYGINSHRLLIRGVRTDNLKNFSLSVTADAMQIDPVILSPIFALPILLIWLLWLKIKKRF